MNRRALIADIQLTFLLAGQRIEIPEDMPDADLQELHKRCRQWTKEQERRAA